MSMELLGKELGYEVIEIDETRYQEAYELEKANIEYTKLCQSHELKYDEFVLDKRLLPPNVSKEAKHFIGYYKNNQLFAMMNYVEGYPNQDILWIGLFMVNINYQGRYYGFKIMNDFFKHTSFKSIRLGVLDTNEAGLYFWKRLGFKEIDRKLDQENNRTIIVMEKKL